MVDADTDWTKTKEMPWAGGMAVWPTALGACREDTHFQFAPTTLLLMLTLLHQHVEGRVTKRVSIINADRPAAVDDALHEAHACRGA